jgi:hypothetical protein
LTSCRYTASPARLGDLATICLNAVAPADRALHGFRLVPTPTPLRRRALELLDVSHLSGSRSQTPAPQITKAQVDAYPRG